MSEWISVKDRLPKPGNYLCFSKIKKRYSDNCIYEVESIDIYYFIDIGSPRFKKDFEEQEITHWMPLPEFPNE